jgi:hypothetical protein
MQVSGVVGAGDEQADAAAGALMATTRAGAVSADRRLAHSKRGAGQARCAEFSYPCGKERRAFGLTVTMT